MNLIPWRHGNALRPLGAQLEHEPSGLRLDDFESHMPAVKIADNEENWIVSVELPGLRAKDIQVRIRGRQLDICGERRQSRRVDTAYGAFHRTIELPANLCLGRDCVAATYERDILEVILPKLDTTTTVEIAVNAG